MSKTNSGKGRLSHKGSTLGGLSRHTKKIALVAVLLLTVTALAVFTAGSERTEAADVAAATVKAGIEGMSDGDTYTMPGEPDGVVMLLINDNNNRTIDGNGLSLPARNGVLHFNITNTGTGTLTFVNMTLYNPNAFTNSGGMLLNGGNYVFENCTFIGITNTAVFFNGSSNSADFTNCTFKNNTNKGVAMSSGTASKQAEFNFKNCYFDSNTVTNGRGAAIGINVGGINGIVYTSVSIQTSLFTNNRAIGTSTVSGGNNAVDGGAVAVVAGGGVLTMTVNIWDSYFEKNFAQDDGGAVLIEGYAAFGGMRIASNIWNCTFTGNTCAGASYFDTAAGIISAGITNGSGGAISYYGLTHSTVTNCTFYNNGVTNTYTGPGTNCGNAGGGGAIGVDTNDGINDPAGLPPVPILTNNIFVGNYVIKSISKTYRVTVPGGIVVDLATQYGVIPSNDTGNVFVFTGADADRQNPATIARPLSNNGNIGYDNGNPLFDNRTLSPTGGIVAFIYRLTDFADDLGTMASSGLTVANVFVNVVAGVPVKENLGAPVGAAGNTGQRYYFMPSPISDELYRDGLGPYFDSTYTKVDALGNPRDDFPNAGAIEIYWTKFDPGAHGDWAVVPATIDNPADVTKPFFATQSLKTPKRYYVSTDVGLPSPEIVAMPRSVLTPDDAQYGFVGWRSNQPDFGWWDAAWASANGYSETNVLDFLKNHAMTDLPKDAFPLYQPGDIVPSVKQILTAEWASFQYRVDFSLNYADPPAHPDPLHNYWLPNPATITQGGWTGNAAVVAPPYINVPYGERIYRPLADPVLSGYVLEGWYKDAACTTKWNFSSDTIVGDIVLYAKWEVETFTVTYSGTGSTGGSPPVDANRYTSGSLVTLLGKGTLTKTGYTFEGWNTSPGAAVPMYVAGDTFNIVDNVILYPVWKVSPSGGIVPPNPETIFRILASADGGSSITPVGEVKVARGGSVTFTFYALPGYEIRSVLIDGVNYPELISAGSYTFSFVARDHTITIVSAIEDRAEPPDDGGDAGRAGATDWSILNLICAIIALAVGMLIIGTGRKRVEDRTAAEPRKSRTAGILRGLGLILGFVSLIVFFLTEDWSLPVGGPDEWTPLMIILLLATVIVSYFSFRFDEKIEKPEQ